MPLRRDTRVFVSAVSKGVGHGAQASSKKALEDSGYHAVEQDNFPLDYRALIDKQRRQIRVLRCGDPRRRTLLRRGATPATGGGPPPELHPLGIRPGPRAGEAGLRVRDRRGLPPTITGRG